MKFKTLLLFSALSIFSIYLILVISLFYYFRAPLFWEVLLSERTLFSLKLSLISATIATLLALLLAIPSAYALSRFDFNGKNLIDTALEIPMIVSPAALGAMILIFFNTPLGVKIQENLVYFVFTAYGVILAQFITVLGISTRLIKTAIDEIPTRYEEVASSLGVSPAKAFFTITLPLCKRGLLASAILTWAKALGEFGATITVAGSMAFKTETLPIAIFMKLASADIEGTVVLILILITIGLSTLYLVRFILKKETL